jgi:hypothetical protein
MVASIWLQPVGDEREILRDLITELAAEYGTMPFEPHLTVCTIADPAAELMQAAADYITACRALPLLAEKTGVQNSSTVPLRAVTIRVENAPGLRIFREALRDLTGANELAEPHISMLYAIDREGRRTAWAGDEPKLEALAAECERRLTVSQFLLGDPILVAPDGDWSNIASWTTIRRF